MRFDFGFELFGRLFRFALLRSGEQSVHGDFRLFGQVKSLLKRVCRISGNDIVGGEHNGSGTLTGCGLGVGTAVGETWQHGCATHHAVADQGSGLFTILRTFQPVGNRLVIAVFHLVDIILRFDAFQYRAGLVELFGHQFVIVGQRKHGT